MDISGDIRGDPARLKAHTGTATKTRAIASVTSPACAGAHKDFWGRGVS